MGLTYFLEIVLLVTVFSAVMVAIVFIGLMNLKVLPPPDECEHGWILKPFYFRK